MLKRKKKKGTRKREGKEEKEKEGQIAIEPEYFWVFFLSFLLASFPFFLFFLSLSPFSFSTPSFFLFPFSFFLFPFYFFLDLLSTSPSFLSFPHLFLFLALSISFIFLSSSSLNDYFFLSLLLLFFFSFLWFHLVTLFPPCFFSFLLLLHLPKAIISFYLPWPKFQLFPSKFSSFPFSLFGKVPPKHSEKSIFFSLRIEILEKRKTEKKEKEILDFKFFLSYFFLPLCFFSLLNSSPFLLSSFPCLQPPRKSTTK